MKKYFLNLSSLCFLAIVGFIFIILFFKGLSFLDPDFGWHLKMGELILSSGIPKTDPFSYTMASFPFVDHEWLTNVLIAKIYPFFGFAALSLIFTILVVSAFLISRKIFSEKLSLLGFDLGLLSLVLVTLMPFFGVRPQVQSWLYLAILLRVLLNKSWHKYIFLLPVFFLFWTNLHGSFAVGIFCFSLIVVIRSFRQKKIYSFDLLILFVCFLATLVNPYGLRLWEEVWQQISDTQLRFRIVEWHPSLFFLNLSYLVLLPFSTFLVFRYRKKILLEELALFVFLLFMSLGSVRHVPLWLVISYPLTIKCLNFLAEEVGSIEFGELRLRKVSTYFAFIALIVFLLEIGVYLAGWSKGKTSLTYPEEAVSYLKTNVKEGEIFSEYQWGGYLIWNLPEKKVFIDGRMPSWRWKKVLPGGSQNAMDEYVKIFTGDVSFDEIAEKYKIKTALLSLPRPKTLDDILSEVIKAKLGLKKGFSLNQSLENSGWKIIYQDKVAVIYAK